MIVNIDAKALEWRAVVHLSKDRTAIDEILNGADAHSDNQKRFGLPSRLIAKKFLFRTIYCPYSIIDRTAYAFSVDNEFKSVGGIKFWERAIEEFYEKYSGIREYHAGLIRSVAETGKLVSETGRVYEFEQRLRKGEYEYPISDIANYPVQGFSADLMAMARVSAYRRLGGIQDLLFVNTVHDSITFDVANRRELWYNIYIEMKKVFKDLQPNFLKIYGKELNIPMDCDFKIGNNWLWMHDLEEYLN